ncbi:MAG: aldehyde dehydrogenase (NADP(+)) [Bacteroidota bacterium]
MSTYTDIPPQEIDPLLDRARMAFNAYRTLSLAKRAALLRAIASELEEMGDEWIQTAHRETNLPEARLKIERARTIYQLESYAMACAQGDWMRISIDTALPDRNPPRPDIRKMMIPLGPVVVFGASNFPYAYSTAGGDTASALAAGCAVIVKAHPAHPETSALAAQAISLAIEKTGMPKYLFQHVYGASFEIGKQLVQQPLTAAVGFTGSFSGGKQLFDWANQRLNPIPVFAEMGSVNPIFVLPSLLKMETDSLAEKVAASVSMGVGQFCTNPGILIAVQGEALEHFSEKLSEKLQQVSPAAMLHAGIQQAYQLRAATLRDQEAVQTILAAKDLSEKMATPQLTLVNAERFISDTRLHQEVFGPATLLVVCNDAAQLLEVANSLEGQLTCSVFGTTTDFADQAELLQTLPLHCGRLNFNNVPTGVEVVQSMHHGGPFPATTDPRFTAVGSDAILRFSRPISYQNCPEEFLPDELKTSNPLKIWRKIDGVWENK